MLDKPMVLVIGEVSHDVDRYYSLQKEMMLVFADNADQVIEQTSDNEPLDVVLICADQLADSALETCRWIKTDNELKQLPFVVIDSDSFNIPTWLSEGAIDVMPSDISPALFQARLKLCVELKHKGDLLTDIASLDRVTSLPDHRRMEEYLDIEWRRSLRDYYSLSIIIIDLYRFKAFRDQYGHGGADDVLKRVARQLESMVNRAADMLSRYADDEFIVLLPSVELDRALALAERMVEAVAGMAIADSASPSGVLTVSAGVATIEPSRDKRYQDLLDEAYEMLGRSRQMGGDQAQGIEV